jgi:two-component system response regulator GlrR
MPSETQMGSILIVDDNHKLLKVLGSILERESFAVSMAANGREAVDRLRREPFDLVVTDLVMPMLGGMEILEFVKKYHPETPVIILTGHGSIESAVDAVKKGAFDYVEKPFHNDVFVQKIRNAFEAERFARDTRRLKSRLMEKKGLEAIVYQSKEMKRIIEQVRLVAAKDVSVIIYGESGTGKELVARAIHYCSPRCDRPVIAVNCASIPESLLENELFGHVKGAYTGANATKKGLFEEANHGTIFLDEIGDISPGVQSKLLRVLQEHEFKKIGGTEDIRVDVRVISATNQDLKAAVEQERFREDLFYRLNVVPLFIPPLRERIDDIPVLAEHFRKTLNDELGLQVKGFAPSCIDAMHNYRWPGNVRELKNKIKMVMIMTRNEQISAEDMDLQDAQAAPAFKTFRQAREEFERDYINRSLKFCKGNVKKAAQLAGRDRSTFYDLLKKYNIEADEYRG